MVIAEWKHPGIFQADPQKVAGELKTLGDEITPDQIVDAARDASTELHKCFEWDNDVAAEKWRKHQARQLLCFLVIREEEPKPDTVPVRVYYKIDDGGYKHCERVFTRADEYQNLLQTALAELRAFKMKYARLQELSEILALIE